MQDLVGTVLKNKSSSGDELRFAVVTGSAAEFKAELRKLVTKLRMRIIGTGLPPRLIPLSRFTTKPVVSGPSGVLR